MTGESDRTRRAREAEAEAEAARKARNTRSSSKKRGCGFFVKGSIVRGMAATRARASPRARRRARRSSRVISVCFVANQAGDARFPSPWQPARRPRGQKPPRLSPVPAREARRARRARALLALRRALRPGGSCGRAGTRPARPRRHPEGYVRAAWCPRDADPPAIGAGSRDGSDRGAIGASALSTRICSGIHLRVLASDAPREMRHPRARASHGKRFPPRTFFLRQPLYGSPERRLHARRAPSDARPRVAGPKSRPRRNAIGGKLTFESRIAIGMTTQASFLVSKMHIHAAARKERKAIQ